MYRFRRSLPSLQTSLIQKRLLARGSLGRIAPKAVPEFDPSESILEKEWHANYLGFDSEKDADLISGGTNFAKKTEDYTAVYERQLSDKYGDLLNTKKVRPTGKTEITSFGHVRLDSDNKVRYHGQYEANEDNTVKFVDIAQKVTKIKMKLPEVSASLDAQESQEPVPRTKKEKIPIPDSEYRPGPSSQKPQISLITDKIRFRFLDEEYLRFAKQSNKELEESKMSDWLEYRFTENEKRGVRNAPNLDEPIDPSANLSDRLARYRLNDNDEEGQIESKRKQMMDKRFRKDKEASKPDLDEEISALDYLKRLNAGKVQASKFQTEYDLFTDLKKQQKGQVLDSKGYRNLNSQLPNFSGLTIEEIAQVLFRSIVYQNDQYLALNKPYGIMHQSNSRMSLKNFLPKLSTLVGVEKLYTVHRLDRDTTGLLLLAKDQESANALSNLFEQRKIQKCYLAITKAVPDIREGIIDIPIENGFIKTGNVKRERAVLAPEITEDIRGRRRTSGSARTAITKFKVLKEHGNAALVELKPETGIKHQLRVHLGFGLRCPILGDHKYSNLDSLLPQKLPSDILGWLRVRQQKARTVPMHLHASELVIPSISNIKRNELKGNVYIKAKAPFHFKTNAKRLGLADEL